MSGDGGDLRLRASRLGEAGDRGPPQIVKREIHNAGPRSPSLQVERVERQIPEGFFDGANVFQVVLPGSWREASAFFKR